MEGNISKPAMEGYLTKQGHKIPNMYIPLAFTLHFVIHQDAPASCLPAFALPIVNVSVCVLSNESLSNTSG